MAATPPCDHAICSPEGLSSRRQTRYPVRSRRSGIHFRLTARSRSLSAASKPRMVLSWAQKELLVFSAINRFSEVRIEIRPVRSRFEYAENVSFHRDPSSRSFDIYMLISSPMVARSLDNTKSNRRHVSSYTDQYPNRGYQRHIQTL